MPHVTRNYLRALLATSALGTLPANGQVIADLRADYDTPITAHTNGQTSAGKIDDTAGTGAWNFYRSSTVDPTAGGASLTLLSYTTGSNSVRNPNAYVAPGAGYDLPGWSSGILISLDGSSAADELQVHPGEFTYAVAAWTSGYSGTVALSAAFRDFAAVGNGVTLDIRLNGSPLFSSGATSGNTYVTFNQSFAVTSSDVLYFVVGNNGDYTSDNSTLSATITAIPEPSAYAALAGLAVLAVAISRRRAALAPVAVRVRR